MWRRYCAILLVAVVLSAAVLGIQDLPRSYAAHNAAPPTLTPLPDAAAAQPSALKPRIYMPLLRRSNDKPAPTATATPRPGTTPQPTRVPAPGTTPQPTMMPGMMEPVAPDWVDTCAPDTVPFEAQGWWLADFGHVHIGFCAPLGQRISGDYTTKVRLILHNNPGKLTLLQSQIDGSSVVQTDRVDVTCPIDQTCAWDRSITLDTRRFSNDGWHHIRIRAVVREPDGKELVATNFIPVYLANGKPVSDFQHVPISGDDNYVAGRGWYTDINYVWSVIFDPPRAKERISGTYKVTVRPMITDNPKSISRFIVKLDGTHTAPGTTLYDSTSDSTKQVELSIDTTTLSNGWHSLLTRTEAANQSSTGCNVCSGERQTQAGTSKIWFYVKN